MHKTEITISHILITKCHVRLWYEVFNSFCAKRSADVHAVQTHRRSLYSQLNTNKHMLNSTVLLISCLTCRYTTKTSRTGAAVVPCPPSHTMTCVGVDTVYTGSTVLTMDILAVTYVCKHKLYFCSYALYKIVLTILHQNRISSIEGQYCQVI